MATPKGSSPSRLTMGCVLDASALLAHLLKEPGAQLVSDRLANAQISSVNWAETLQFAIFNDIDIEALTDTLGTLGLRILPFTSTHAFGAARLRAPTQHLGLSLADRACLTVASEEGLPVLTADRSWAQLDLDVEVELIR